MQHVEGAAGGHVPDNIAVVSNPDVLPCSSNTTIPYTVNTLDEHRTMIMVANQGFNNNVPEEHNLAGSRIRENTLKAEGYLHDIGAISMIASNSQAMGRCGEIISRTWQTASKNKIERGALPEDQDSDNFRVMRYIAKYTINPAISYGISEWVGSIEVGKVADLVLWDFADFGVKPHLVLKSGFIAWSQMVRTCSPVARLRVG
jgi:urease